jgi:hypothetical protein
MRNRQEESSGVMENVEVGVHDWLCKQPTDFFSGGIQALVKCWNKRIERNGVYVGK